MPISVNASTSRQATSVSNFDSIAANKNRFVLDSSIELIFPPYSVSGGRSETDHFGGISALIGGRLLTLEAAANSAFDRALPD
ncbi:MAG: hypothetical protein ACR2RV_01390 [Verrucomicrobiales bacterium]